MSFQPPSAQRAFATELARRVSPAAQMPQPSSAAAGFVIRGPGMPGALARGMFVAALVMLPALVIPGIAPETANLAVLLALFAAVLTAYEYSSPYPGLLEFRFGAPYNRTRFFYVVSIALLMAVLQRHGTDPGPFTGLVAGAAAACGALLAQAPSPVALLAASLPEGVTAAERALVRDGAALALVMAVMLLAGFAGATRLGLWPHGARPFNLWINLPTFEPTAGRIDVVTRLRRQAALNMGAGLALPFLLPGVVLASTILMQPVSLTSPLGYVWGIVLWAYVPVALMMRGMAMARVARLIEDRRARLDPDLDPDLDSAGTASVG